MSDDEQAIVHRLTSFWREMHAWEVQLMAYSRAGDSMTEEAGEAELDRLRRLKREIFARHVVDVIFDPAEDMSCGIDKPAYNPALEVVRETKIEASTATVITHSTAENPCDLQYKLKKLPTGQWMICDGRRIREDFNDQWVKWFL
jgi:hypothetical protein